MSTLNLAIVLHRLQLHCGNKSNFVAMETQQQLLYALVDQRIHNYNCSNISDAVSEIQVNVSPLLSLSPIFSPCNSSPYSPLSSLLSPHLIFLHIPTYYPLSLFLLLSSLPSYLVHSLRTRLGTQHCLASKIRPFCWIRHKVLFLPNIQGSSFPGLLICQ